jgi:hypothetical protein
MASEGLTSIEGKEPSMISICRRITNEDDWSRDQHYIRVRFRDYRNLNRELGEQTLRCVISVAFVTLCTRSEPGQEWKSLQS